VRDEDALGSDDAPHRFPSFALYGQPLLRVEAGGEVFWLEPASRLVPFGATSPGARDVPAVVLPEPGERPLDVRTPAPAPGDERRDLVVRVALAADGSAKLSGSDTYRGMLGAGVKGALERLDARSRKQAIEALLAEGDGLARPLEAERGGGQGADGAPRLRVVGGG